MSSFERHNLRMLSAALTRCYHLRLENQALRNRVAILERQIRDLTGMIISSIYSLS